MRSSLWGYTELLGFFAVMETLEKGNAGMPLRLSRRSSSALPLPVTRGGSVSAPAVGPAA
jgi:hypothetical protein